MVSVDEIRDQLRDALAELEAVMANPVPAEEVFFVRDTQGFAHVAGFCVTDRKFPSGVQWEVGKGQDLTNLTLSCACVQRTPNVLTGYVERVERMFNSEGPIDDVLWFVNYPPLFSTFPHVFEAWERVYRSYFRLVVADVNFLEYQAASLGVPVSQLPSVGVCTMQYKYPAELEVFPNGVSAVVPWVESPDVATVDLLNSPDRYTLRGVEGWPVERVEVVSTLIRDAGSRAEAFAAFKLAKQLVP